MCLSEKSHRLVYASLQHSPFGNNLDSNDCCDNMQVINWLDLIPNLVFPIFVILEKPQTTKEEVTTH